MLGSDSRYLMQNDGLVVLPDGRALHARDNDYRWVTPRYRGPDGSDWTHYLSAYTAGKLVVHDDRLCRVVVGPTSIHGKWMVRIRPVHMQQGEGTSHWLQCRDIQAFSKDRHTLKPHPGFRPGDEFRYKNMVVEVDEAVTMYAGGWRARVRPIRPQTNDPASLVVNCEDLKSTD